MGREFELKFQADPAKQEAIAQAYPQACAHYRMESRYYDTPNGDFSRRRYTLRCRQENDTFICTLKTPAENGGRGEFETESREIADALPYLQEASGVADLSALAENGLVEVCGARFQRKAITLDLGDAVVELALDSGVLTGGGRERAFQEVEVELKTGAEETAERFARELARRFALREEKRSKFQRAIALAKGEE